MKKINSGLPFLLLTIIFFSTLEVVSHTIAGKIDSFQLTFIRFFLGAILMFVILSIQKDLKIDRKDLIYLAELGILNIVFSMNLLQFALGIPDSSPAVIAVIFSSNPVFVMLFSNIKNREHFKANQIVGLAAALGGIVVIMSSQLKAGNLLSVILAFGSSVIYGLYTLMGQKAAAKLGSVKMNAYSFLLGSIAMIPLLLILKRPIFIFDFSALPQVLYISFFVTGLAYITYFIGIKKAGGSKGSLVFFLKPVFASIISMIVLKEYPGVVFFAGVLLILCGIWFVLYGERLIHCRDS